MHLPAAPRMYCHSSLAMAATYILLVLDDFESKPMRRSAVV